MKLFLLTLLIAGLACAASADDSSRPGAAVWAVQINVTDIDEAIEFYTDGLGMEVATREYYPQVVSLKNDGGAILLYRVDERVEYEYNRSVYCNYRVADLDSMITRLRSYDVPFRHQTPQRAAIGRYIGLRDPSGNILHIMELDEQYGSVESTRLFNVGVPITNKDTALAFYRDILGFESIAEQYWPPVLPLKGNGMELVGHLTDSTVPYRYPFKSGTFIILETDALHTTCTELSAAGLSFEFDSPITHAPVGWYQAVRDPFGHVVEIIQPVDNPFDRARGIERPREITAGG